MYVASYFPAHISHFVTTNPDDNFTLITGFKVDMPWKWHGDVSYTYGRDRTCGICQIGSNLDVGAFQHAVNTGAINPLSNEPLTAAQKAMFLGDNIQWSRMGIKDFNTKFNGPLFDLPGGTVRAAVGFEYYYNSEHIVNGANRTNVPSEGIVEGSPLPPDGYEGVGCVAPYPCPPRTTPNQFAIDNIGGLNRKVTSAYGEIYIPVVGKGNAIPLVQALEIDAAVRYDHYSDFGDTTNPKVGVTWKVDDDLKLRGSWGTSFRAPTLTDINPFVFSVKVGTSFPNYTTDPNIDHTVCIPGLFCLSNTLFFLGAPDGYDISPDGKEVCYTSNRATPPSAVAWTTNNDLYIVSSVGGEATNITADNKGSDASPQYSPDGRYIAASTANNVLVWQRTPTGE